jgi:hypothetical protein
MEGITNESHTSYYLESFNPFHTCIPYMHEFKEQCEPAFIADSFSNCREPLHKRFSVLRLDKACITSSSKKKKKKIKVDVLHTKCNVEVSENLIFLVLLQLGTGGVEAQTQ